MSDENDREREEAAGDVLAALGRHFTRAQRSAELEEFAERRIIDRRAKVVSILDHVA